MFGAQGSIDDHEPSLSVSGDHQVLVLEFELTDTAEQAHNPALPLPPPPSSQTIQNPQYSSASSSGVVQGPTSLNTYAQTNQKWRIPEPMPSSSAAPPLPTDFKACARAMALVASC